MGGQEKPVIGVVGLGTMGLGIAQVYAAAGFKVLATDGQSTARDSAVRRVADTLALRVASGKLTAQAREATLANLVIGAVPEALQPCALIIEAIIEDLDAKPGFSPASSPHHRKPSSPATPHPLPFTNFPSRFVPPIFSLACTFSTLPPPWPSLNSSPTRPLQRAR